MNARTKSQERIRLSLEVNQAVRDRLDRLAERGDGASLTEVVRRALAVYETLSDIRDEGSALIVERDGELREKLVFL